MNEKLNYSFRKREDKTYIRRFLSPDFSHLSRKHRDEGKETRETERSEWSEMAGKEL